MHLEAKFLVSQRRACAVSGQSRSTQMRLKVESTKEDGLVCHIEELVREHSQYGYRRITSLLRRVGPCELMRLEWTDVNFEGSYIHVKNANKGNQDPWRDVPIKEALIPLFKQWHEQDKNLGLEYLVHFKGKPIYSIKRNAAGK